MKSGSISQKRILELRRKNKSYGEIAEILGMSKGKISYWLSKDPESILIKAALTKRNIERSRKRIRKVITAMRKYWKDRKDQAVREARGEFNELLLKPLFISGVMLYWGEGDSKPRNPLRLSNTDPRMIKIYSRFVRDILLVPDDKVKLALTLYPDLDEVECKAIWAKAASFKKVNFSKTQYIQGYHPTKRLAYGICQVVVCDQRKKAKVLEWIDLCYKNIKI